MTSSATVGTTYSNPDVAEINIYGQGSPDRNNGASGNNDSRRNRMWKESSFNFSNDAVNSESSLKETSRFHENNEMPSNRSSNVELDEVVVCSSNNSVPRTSGLMRTITKSRLVDPPDEINQQSQTQRMVKSKVLGKGRGGIDVDDPFLGEDLPEDYKRMKYNAFSFLQLLSLILIVAALVCNLTINIFKRRSVFGLEMWRWELMVLVLISGRLVSGWGIQIMVFFIERNYLLRKRVLYFVYGLRNAVQNCMWLTLVLIAWQCVFDEKVKRVNKKILPYVTRIWICLLVGTLIWLPKTLVVKVLASSFHVSTFFDRIQESLFNQYVIEMLSGPPFVEIQQKQEDEERVIVEVQKLESVGASIPAHLRPNTIIGSPKKSTVCRDPTTPVFSTVMSKENGITIDHLHRLNQKNISAWNMKRLMNIVKKGVVSTIDEKTQGGSTCEDAAVLITSEDQANVAAKKIFINVAKQQSKYIYQKDLMRFMREEEVIKTMRLFEDGSEQKGISEQALNNWMVNVFGERRALALSLNDTKTAVHKLHQMMNALVGIIILVIWVLILKVATTHFFIFLSSQLLLVVFMFGNTCKTTFEAVIFLFVMHPFDVGDRVEVEGVQMVVEEMNILTTVFLKYDNNKIYYPNSVLSTKPINNYYRSPDMGDAIDFYINITTPVDKIATMKERITRYINNRSDHWHPGPMIVLRDVEDMYKLQFSVWLEHRINFQDMGERWTRRALLVEEMVKIWSELDIQYRVVPLDVNVHNMPPISSARLPSNWVVGSAA
ncbi:hypothetical protein BUALT_Bualt08G0092800 [Buddleja alternifolia]|uniref:Mechanosensitive ion channel protein n=1 Tax=Buddleja alternifolia TaxID=168488 RepID=A0AAV6XDB7_9LAMI|nr:hypothetical protein BUALT_Bualt08G0092800 [Buddleja alternifolia]